MSYDVSLMIDTGNDELCEVVDVGNYTYNVSPMFYDALGGEGLNGLHGKLASEAALLLKPAVEKLTDPANLAYYEAMNPPNGWGNHDGAKMFLRKIMEACERHPKTTVHIS